MDESERVVDLDSAAVSNNGFRQSGCGCIPSLCSNQVKYEEMTDEEACRGSLDKLIFHSQMEFIFFGGKGGVGKTTTSSSFSVQLAKHKSLRGEKGVLLISTDPAHSLSDAFNINFFGTEPVKVEGVDNLEVLEIDPSDMMRKEFAQWSDLGKKAGMGDFGEKIDDFVQWIQAVPGLDEGTALASVLEYIENGTYSTIVFDTAPTGHTLKMLQLPKILDIGLSKLQSFQSKMWDYVSMFRMMTGKQDELQAQVQIKKDLADKLSTYKKGIERLTAMITDQVRTTFVVVCIAEALSINESRRLLEELLQNEVHSEHIVCNQLVPQEATFTTEEMELVQNLSVRKREKVESSDTSMLDRDDDELREKLLACARLTSSRHKIQSKYLRELCEMKRPKSKIDAQQSEKFVNVVKVPLLSLEIVGVEGLKAFGNLLISRKQHALSTKK